jgi:tRNA(Ile)-lysidine synthase
MRLFQGAGPRGLAGIAPVRGALIRPLLDVRRHEILAHLATRGLEWIEDATNSDLRFLRNRIRHDVLPFLVRRVGPDVVEALCHGAALHREAIVGLESRARAALARVATRGPSGFVFPLAELTSRTPDLAAQMLLLAAAEGREMQPRRAAVHRAMRRLLSPSPPRRPVRLGGLSAERSGSWVRVGPARLLPLAARSFRVPGSADLPEIGARLQALSRARGADYVVPRDARRVAFDADRLPDTLHVRARRSGDRFAPFGGPADRRLKSFLIDAGVPRWDRARVPLLEAEGEIIWVAGLRRGQRAPVGADTKRILEVTLVSL